MRVSELAERTGLSPLNEYKDREIEGVYISDMVSDIITGAKANGILVTLQTHKSLIAAANLVDVAAVVFVRGKKPAEDVVLPGKPVSDSSSPISIRGPSR